MRHSKNNIIALILILIFFVGDNVLTKYNIQLQMHKFLILALCCMFTIKIKNIGSKYFPQVVKLLLFIVLYTLFKIYTGGSAGNTNMGIIVLIPVFVFLTFVSAINVKNMFWYKKLLYIAFVIECGIALIEKLLNINVFQLGIGDEMVLTSEFTSTEFRSIALYGHPLQNALVVFCFLLFILVYENNIKQKFGLAVLGIMSIFCFNTRAAIVISVFCFVVYVFYWMRTNKVSFSIKFITFSVVFLMGVGIVYLYTNGIIGGRLSSMGLYDDKSASVRLDAFTIFDYYNLSDFITGISYNDLQMLKYRTGLYAIENFWLNWLFSYGLIFVVGLIFFYFPVIKRLFKKEKTFVKLFIIIPFFVLASTNPSLAVSIVPMSAFLLLAYIMPKTIK